MQQLRKRGHFVPSFVSKEMENLTQQIREWLAPKLEELDCFLVDVKVNASGTKLEVYLDKDSGLTIDICQEVSRFLEFYLDNGSLAPSNYNLEVSSPGMDNPFKVERQFRKNLGKTVEVLLNSGVKKEGVLQAYDEQGLTLTIYLPPAKKGLAPETREEHLLFSDIKYTKKKISF